MCGCGTGTGQRRRNRIDVNGRFERFMCIPSFPRSLAL